MFYPDIQRWKPREFWERGKPTSLPVAPQYSYAITRLYNDLWAKARDLQVPFDHVFALRDVGIAVDVRIVRSEVAKAESWSINGRPFIFNDCGARTDEILKLLNHYLLHSCGLTPLAPDAACVAEECGKNVV